MPEVEQIDSESDNDSVGEESLNLNESNLHKFNAMLSKYLQEYKTSEISTHSHAPNQKH